MMERILNVKGDYEVADLGSSPEVDAPEIIEAALACGLQFASGYPEQVLRKYYGRA